LEQLRKLHWPPPLDSAPWILKPLEDFRLAIDPLDYGAMRT
jgi:hypothetical protein